MMSSDKALVFAYFFLSQAKFLPFKGFYYCLSVMWIHKWAKRSDAFKIVISLNGRAHRSVLSPDNIIPRNYVYVYACVCNNCCATQCGMVESVSMLSIPCTCLQSSRSVLSIWDDRTDRRLQWPSPVLVMPICIAYSIRIDQEHLLSWCRELWWRTIYLFSWLVSNIIRSRRYLLIN